MIPKPCGFANLAGQHLPRIFLFLPPSTGVIESHHCAWLLHESWGSKLLFADTVITLLTEPSISSAQQFIYLFVCFLFTYLFIETVTLCTAGWQETHCEAEMGLKLVIILLPQLLSFGFTRVFHRV